MTNAICNMPPTEHDAVLAQFSGTLDLEEEREARKLFPQFLFFHNEYGDDSGLYDASTPVRICHCTSCGESFEAVRGNYARGKMHHEALNCPQCGAELEGIAVYKYKYNMASLTSWVKTATVRIGADDALLIEAGEAKRSFNWDELDGEIEWHPRKRYYLRRGTIQMWEKRTIWEGCFCVGHDWLPRMTLGDPFPPNLMGYANYYGEYSLIGLGRLRQNKAWAYCQIGDFYRYEYAAEIEEGEAARWIIKYLAWYALHPQIEMAVKFNLRDAVRDLIERGKKNTRLIDWEAANPPAFLRMNKQDAALFLSQGGDFTELRFWRENCRGLSLRRFQEMAQRVGKANLPTLSSCAKTARVDMPKAAHYVESLMPLCERYAPTPGQILQTWKDYLDLAAQLGYDLREHSVAMPKDLQTRHDAAASTIRINKNAAEMKKYKYRRRKLDKQYAFAMGGYAILVPTCSEEIIQEGKTLHHCVGGYAARHIEGKTTILFLRRQRKPARPFLTIELAEKKGKVIIRQIHGYRNEGYDRNAADPKKKFAWFLEQWLAWVNNGSQRDKEGRPILPEIQEVKTA